jgi:hypothetical protein
MVKAEGKVEVFDAVTEREAQIYKKSGCKLA